MVERIADLIEREAGNIGVGILLILLAGVFHKLGLPKADDMLMFALGIVSRSMFGLSSRQGRRRGKLTRRRSAQIFRR